MSNMGKRGRSRLKDGFKNTKTVDYDGEHKDDYNVDDDANDFSPMSRRPKYMKIMSKGSSNKKYSDDHEDEEEYGDDTCHFKTTPPSSISSTNAMNSEEEASQHHARKEEVKCSSADEVPSNSSAAKACSLIEELGSCLDEERKGLLKKIFAKYPNLMDVNRQWSKRLASFMFEEIAELVLLMCRTSVAAMDGTTRDEMEAILVDLERNECDVTFIGDMRALILEKWASHVRLAGVAEEAEGLALKIQQLRAQIEYVEAELQSTLHALMKHQDESLLCIV